MHIMHCYFFPACSLLGGVAWHSVALQPCDSWQSDQVQWVPLQRPCVTQHCVAKGFMATYELNLQQLCPQVQAHTKKGPAHTGWDNQNGMQSRSQPLPVSALSSLAANLASLISVRGVCESNRCCERLPGSCGTRCLSDTFLGPPAR
jgi:hypothetical protein